MDNNCAIAIDSQEYDSKYQFVYHETPQMEMCEFAERARMHDIPVQLDGYKCYGEKFYSAFAIGFAKTRARSKVVNDFIGDKSDP